jgi:hypothetical protein
LLTPPVSAYHCSHLITKPFREIKASHGIGRNSFVLQL